VASRHVDAALDVPGTCFFISLSALFSGVLNSYGKFALPAYTQVIMNVVMIIVALWIAPHADNPGVALAMGVFVSGLLQLGFQVPAVMRSGVSAGRSGGPPPRA
jgi:putative peptidoglycan lipid II flippase